MVEPAQTFSYSLVLVEIKAMKPAKDQHNQADNDNCQKNLHDEMLPGISCVRGECDDEEDEDAERDLLA